MIKAKSEISSKNSKPAFDLLYGRRMRSSLFVNIVIAVGMLIGCILMFKPILMVALFGRKEDFVILVLLFCMLIFLMVSAAVNVVKCLKARAKLSQAGDKVTGIREYEFDEDGVFSRVTKEGFLCERFFVYSTVESVIEYKGNFIVQTRGAVGVFDGSDIFEGDADKLRELLRTKLGKRFRVIKW